MMRRTFRAAIALAAVRACFAISFALSYGQEFDERFDDWPLELRIRGTVVVASDLENVAVLKSAIDRSAATKRVSVLVDSESPLAIAGDLSKVFGETDGDDERKQTVLRAETGFAGQLASAVENAAVLCWHVPTPFTQPQLAALTDAEGAVAKHVGAGRTLIAVGPAASSMGEHFLGQAKADDLQDLPDLAEGANLLPDCIVATNYDDAADRGKLLAALALKPRSVAIGIEKNTAIVLAGRLIRVVGTGKATFMLMANERQPLRIERIAAQSSPRQAPEEYLIDLTEWRRDAIDRTLEPFPPAEVREPRVENGSLVIVGGGGMPKGMMRRFVELAGGVKDAKLVYVPCAEEDDVGGRHGTVEEWKRMGVEHATFIHTKDRRRANEDEAILKPLRDATGIWFGGGRQWNLSDSYYGTTAHRLMKEVLQRGGVIGGSSAGASIQARYLARGTPIGNFRIMAPGYERGGLGFLDGVAIDQHFSQRGRHKDMAALVAKYPQLLGIGIDEATAIVVQKTTAEVFGGGKVFFFDNNPSEESVRGDVTVLSEGERYDLVNRKELAKKSNSVPDNAPMASEPSER
jgi:cyanophycinase